MAGSTSQLSLSRWLSFAADRSHWPSGAWPHGQVAVSQVTAAIIWMAAVASMGDDEDKAVVESRAAGEARPSLVADSNPGVVGFGREQTEYYEVIFRESQRKQVSAMVGWF